MHSSRERTPPADSPVAAVPRAHWLRLEQSESSAERPDDHRDVEKTNMAKPSPKAVLHHARPNIGLTFYVRRSTGATKQLAAHDNLLTLI